MEQMEAAAAADTGSVRIVSRRMVRPSSSKGDSPSPPPEDIHLTPWDLRLLTIDYIQFGILLPKPPTGGDRLVDGLASSLARALERYYHFAGRLATNEHGEDATVTISLRCTNEGAELVHASAPGVAVTDIIGSVYIPSSVVWAFFPLNGVLGVDAAIKPLPVLAVQVTELADGVFVGMSLNHGVADGTVFWEFFNTWSEISRGDNKDMISRPAPVHQRWFVGTNPVPIPLPLSKLQHAIQRFELPLVQEAFFTFSAASIKKLKARANEEMAGGAAATISSLQALLAHLWRAVCRARRLLPEQETSYTLIFGCRGRVDGILPGYVGNAVLPRKTRCVAGDILDKGLGWTAWQLNRAVDLFDEASVREFLDRWPREPTFAFVGNVSAGGTGLTTGGSPRFDMFGNDFGWGKPVAVRSGGGFKTDGNADVFEGPEKGGSMSLELCLVPDVLGRLVADDEFMDAVSVPRQLNQVINTPKLMWTGMSLMNGRDLLPWKLTECVLTRQRLEPRRRRPCPPPEPQSCPCIARV
ncbi:hypothetical protein BRADI_3g13527v3 [Brachypodium distachyon]|uniref:Acetyltransferase n=2 Tax=Brachypodium distachyon TaxID=15368 RepID=A0A0Q3F997_BRADI|nr:hypothetical protein BRADI_3g13527v3 [Brachypodium distachyon]